MLPLSNLNPQTITIPEAQKMIDASSMSPLLKAAGRVALMHMNDAQLRTYAGHAEAAADALKAGDEKPARAMLAKLGLTGTLVDMLIVKAKGHIPS